MKKLFRVTRSEDFGKIVKNGRVFKNACFTLHTLKNDLTHIRVGVSVSSKLGNAVTRNKIKRQVRAMIDHAIDYSSTNLDIVIVVRDGYLTNDFSVNSNKLMELVSKTEARK